MEIVEVINLLATIQGCTFAALDAETRPVPGVKKITTGERVLLFTNKNCSGYENMVKRRLREAGKNPDNFVLSDLPWGERVKGTPLIEHNGKYYLQCICLDPGQSEYFIANRKVDPEYLNLPKKRPNQGLGDNSVYVHTYALESITRLSVKGEIIEFTPSSELFMSAK